MFKIATFCGSKFGGWHPGSTRYPDAESAKREIDAIHRAETRCDATRMMRKVVVA